MTSTFVDIFTRSQYLFTAVTIAVGMFLALAWLDQFLFFTPYLTFYPRLGEELDLTLIFAIAVLTGILVSLNVYKFRGIEAHSSGTGSGRVGFIGSTLGLVTGVCGCSSIGFSIISTFGIAGSLATSILYSYKIPLRVVSIIILAGTIYVSLRSINYVCKLNENQNKPLP